MASFGVKNGPTVSAAAILGLIDAASSLDDGLGEMLWPMRQEYRDPTDRVPEDALIAIWQDIAQHSSNPDIGLEIGVCSFPEAQGLLSSWVNQSPTLGDAVRIFADNIRLMNAGEHWTVEASQQCLRIDVSFTRMSDYPKAALHRSLSAIISRGEVLAGKPLKPLRVGFAHNAPQNLDRFHAIFGSEVLFGTSSTFIEFNAEMMGIAIKSANPLMKTLIEHQSKDMLDRIDDDTPVDQKVRTHIRLLLAERKANADFVAGKMGMSRPSLYRLLKDQGTSFSEILEETRKELAWELVKSKKLAMGDIALKVGFSDASAFRRAFRRWFNRLPTDIQ